MNKINITQAEWQVMRIVLAYSEITSSDVIDILSKNQHWRPTTTKTLISRLLKKKCLGRRYQKNKYYYFPLIDEKNTTLTEILHVFEHLCDKKTGLILHELVNHLPLSKKDIQSIENLLTEKKREAPAEIECHCPPHQCICTIDGLDNLHK